MTIGGLAVDIAERLRETGCDREPFTPGHGECKCRLANAAADEIDRLRRMLEPTCWTDDLREGSVYHSLDEATEDAPDGEPTELTGWAKVAHGVAIKSGDAITFTDIS